MKEIRVDTLRQAVVALRHGNVIVFPTETLYGLGADALNIAAVEKVFQLKDRDPDNPIPVLVSDRTMLISLLAEIPPLAEQLMERFWPGPLTLVLPARGNIPRPLVNRSGGIGVRISSQPIATALVNLLGRPLTATSANPSGKPGARTVAQARGYFSGSVELFLDGGELNAPKPSTVVEVVGSKLTIIRRGAIDASALYSVIGEGGITK